MKGKYIDLYTKNGNEEIFICGTMLRDFKYYKEINLNDYDTLEREYYFYHPRKEYEEEYYHLLQQDVIQKIINAYLENGFTVKRIGEQKYLILGDTKQTR